MKITIKDIAKMADVSTATVSKIVNHKDQNISQATRQKVLDLIETHNYVPNRVASSMITKKTNSIGLIIPDITNPFFPEVARGVEDYANMEGYHVVLCNSDNDLDKEVSYIGMLQEKMVDGIIFTSSSLRNKVSKEFLRLQIPVITVDRDITGMRAQGKITVDNMTGAYQGVSYMIERGYKKILHLGGPMTSKPALDRFEGYKTALNDHGIKYDEKLFFEGNYNAQWGYEGVTQAITNNLEFDGIFCGNDMIAIGAIKALNEKGISVPENIGVIGFDDIYMATVVTPNLTTVRQPNYRMGYKAAEMLIELIKHPERKMKDVVLKTKLVIRESTK
ncbi:MAG: LacI family DNA-binding transcriptional regulator [Bacillota bacterium]|nr:LacI family DNA-binding transcriptional regulator [Bacillota bacterium]